MKQLSVKELRQVELDILDDVANFCDSHNLRYYLCGGTLLGAIRHQGFIPWDDDIDIIMPRPDYIKFHSLYNKRYRERKSFYRINSIFTDPNWYSTAAEIEDTRTIRYNHTLSSKQERGISIDVFPMDGAPANEFRRRVFWLINNIGARIATLSFQSFTVSRHFDDEDKRCKTLRKYLRTFIKFAAILPARCLKPLHLNKWVTDRAMKYDIDKSQFIGVSTFPHYGYRECIRNKNFLQIRKHIFEGKYYNIPMDYDTYLSNIYGDYMKPPSQKSRNTHHNFSAYWKK